MTLRLAAQRWQQAFRQGTQWLFEGSVSPWCYAALRVGIALIFLVRHADWLGSWVYLEHHRAVHGLAYLHDSVTPPLLRSPLIPGLALSAGTTCVLVYARTLFSFSLLFGVRARSSAALLALTSYLLLAADRYRYFHHLHLLYVTLFWLSLAPLGERLNLERGLRRLLKLPPPALAVTSPAWPLQLVRALALSVYAAAGVSKLDWVWLRGDTLRHLQELDVLQGPAWKAMSQLFGYAGVARLACMTELGLLPLLLFVRTRRAGVLIALGFHAAIGASMPVYTFGAQMAVLLMAFWFPVSVERHADARRQSPVLEALEKS